MKFSISSGKIILVSGFLLATLLVLAIVVYNEFYASTLQSHYVSRYVKKLTYSLEAGEGEGIPTLVDGPYDRRLGYSSVDRMLDSARGYNFRVSQQARISEEFKAILETGVFPIYREKSQAGLLLTDRNGKGFYKTVFPAFVYSDFSAIPKLVVDTLLFIENRELLDAGYPGRNPAVEWDRFAKAMIDAGIKVVRSGHKVPGGSTLATQIEKFRHSPGGRTHAARDKLRQMLSASFRAYLDGPDTTTARQRIVLDYINSIPLSAIPLFGEVNGLGDGLAAWYSLSFSEANTSLAQCEATEQDTALERCAFIFKKVLSLFVAQRRPSYYLARQPDKLEALTNKYLRLLRAAEIISEELFLRAKDLPLEVRKEPLKLTNISFLERKADTSVRTELLKILGIKRLYELDRYDLSASVSLDTEIQRNISSTLLRLHTEEFVQQQGLRNEHLLRTKAALDKVIYSITLYEKGADRNYLRIQTDNFNQPFNSNIGVKLDLGSTAKLRTLANYLEILVILFKRYQQKTPKELQAIKPHRSDKLSQWVIQYFLSEKKPSLTGILNAAMKRRYSASPYETFFTGSGQHRFSNFNNDDNGKTPTVQEAFRHSVNLPFIRLMRDIVNYYIFADEAGLGRILEDKTDERRKTYLARFADSEGKVFLRRFYDRYAKKSVQEIKSTLFENVRSSPERIAAVLRALDPFISLEIFKNDLLQQLPALKYTQKQFERLYERYDYATSNWPDRGYVARIHPLELWIAGYLMEKPEASLSEALTASAAVRQEVYQWLFKTRHKNAQDSRIRIMLETEAFVKIHRDWQLLGYPFQSLVPSYATAIGSSADRPSALTELMGIIINDGLRKPLSLIDTIHFGAGTPYEVVLQHEPPSPQQVMDPEVAKVLKYALSDIVQNGTARRLKGAFDTIVSAPDHIGGKTGTGDHRYEVYGPGGRLKSSRVVNRTATFVFYIGDRFFGTVVAYVAGSEAEQYTFTSALPVQILKILAPDIIPLSSGTYQDDRT